jgi:AcrR family transcriptional regulator
LSVSRETSFAALRLQPLQKAARCHKNRCLPLDDLRYSAEDLRKNSDSQGFAMNRRQADAEPNAPAAGKTIPPVNFSPARDLRKGAQTRERVLKIAEASVLAKGFAATSIDEIIAEAGITKSGFFYHFKDKNELARAMIRRYASVEDEFFDSLFDRARQLADDPLQAFLIGLKLLAEMLRDLPNGHPGCLIASVCYQERLFDREVRNLMAKTVKAWNTRFLSYLEEIAAIHPPRAAVDLADLAKMLSCVVDGAIIMSKALHDPHELERQVLAYRAFIKLVFTPAPSTQIGAGDGQPRSRLASRRAGAIKVAKS